MHEDVRNIAKQLLDFKLDRETSKKLRDAFFQIMRENGIKRGTVDEKGVRFNNYEWTICLELFFSKIRSDLEFDFVMKNTPRDLLYY